MGAAGPTGRPGDPGIPGPGGPTGPPGLSPTVLAQLFPSPGLMNGDTLEGDVVCPGGSAIAGGYTIAATRPEDQEKITPFRNYPSDPRTWTVVMAASANVQPFVLTVYATCN